MNRALQIDFILSIPTIKKKYKINTNTNLILLDQGNDVPESIWENVEEKIIYLISFCFKLVIRDHGLIAGRMNTAL